MKFNYERNTDQLRNVRCFWKKKKKVNKRKRNREGEKKPFLQKEIQREKKPRKKY